jgi:hypothetical protein
MVWQYWTIRQLLSISFCIRKYRPSCDNLKIGTVCSEIARYISCDHPIPARPVQSDCVHSHSKCITIFLGHLRREKPIPVAKCAQKSMIRSISWLSPGHHRSSLPRLVGPVVPSQAVSLQCLHIVEGQMLLGMRRL